MSHSQIAGGHRPPLQFESFVARNKILVTILIGRELSGSFKVSNVTKVGVVAYDPKVVTIWEGIKDYFTANHVAIDFVLFSNYDAQVDALLDGWIGIAWNTNLAYVKVHRRTEGKCRVLAIPAPDPGSTPHR